MGETAVDSAVFINVRMTVRPLSPALVKKAEKEINEKSQRIASDIAAIRDWLRKQSHLESVIPTDQWLIAFLRGSKYSLERCKDKMEMYYTYKTIVPEFFEKRDPLGPGIQEILKLGIFLPVRNCHKADSPRTCIMRLGVFDTAKIHLADLIKVAFMITEILMLEDDNFTISGEDLILDLKDVGMSVISQFTPVLAKKVTSCFEKALPVRVKSNHIIRISNGFETVYTIFKSFLGEKLKKRIKLHNKDYVSIYKTIPKTILPFEYGGSDGDLQELTDHWKAKVESYRDWFLQQEDARSDESKRSDGTIKNFSLVFGIEGSFRKLEVD